MINGKLKILTEAQAPQRRSSRLNGKQVSGGRKIGGSFKNSKQF